MRYAMKLRLTHDVFRTIVPAAKKRPMKDMCFLMKQNIWKVRILYRLV